MSTAYASNAEFIVALAQARDTQMKLGILANEEGEVSDKTRNELLSRPRLAFERRGAYMWATFVNMEKPVRASWKECHFAMGNLLDLSDFRLPTVQEVFSLFDTGTKSCRVFRGVHDFSVDTPIWTNEFVFTNGDSQIKAHMAAVDGHLSAEYEAELGFPLFVKVDTSKWKLQALSQVEPI